MKYRVLLLVILFSAFSFSQEKEMKSSRLSLEINYPFHFNNKSDSYKNIGIVGVGVRYKFADIKKVSLGLSYTVDLLIEKTNYSPDYDNLFLPNHFDGFFEYAIPGAEDFIVFSDIGYTLLVYDSGDKALLDGIYELENSNFGNGDKLHHGFNFKLGFKLFVTKKLYLQTYFHNLRLKRSPNSVSQYIVEKSYANFNQLKLGLGFCL